jgi:group I intron endonuclease
MKAGVSGVYHICSVSTGQSYVGSSVCFKQRWKVHRALLKAGKHHSFKLQVAWGERGEEDFERLVLEFVPDKTLLIAREQYWIDQLDAYRSGFNMRPMAGSALGVIRGPEVRARMSAAKRNQSAETRAKISASLTGRKRSPETCARMREAQRGRKISPEHAAKISEALRGRKRRRDAEGRFSS